MRCTPKGVALELCPRIVARLLLEPSSLYMPSMYMNMYTYICIYERYMKNEYLHMRHNQHPKFKWSTVKNKVDIWNCPYSPIARILEKCWVQPKGTCKKALQFFKYHVAFQGRQAPLPNGVDISPQQSTWILPGIGFPWCGRFLNKRDTSKRVPLGKHSQCETSNSWIAWVLSFSGHPTTKPKEPPSVVFRPKHAQG